MNIFSRPNQAKSLAPGSQRRLTDWFSDKEAGQQQEKEDMGKEETHGKRGHGEHEGGLRDQGRRGDTTEHLE